MNRVPDRDEGLNAEAAQLDPEWDAFLETQPDAGFNQSSWWSNFLLSRGWDQFGVVVHDGDTIVGGARVMRYEFAPGQCYYYIPEGPVLPRDKSDAAEVFQQVIDTVEGARKDESRVVSHLRLEPRWQEVPDFITGFQQARDWLEPRNTLYIDLRPSDGEILGQMKPKGRYNVGVARKHGVTVVEDVSTQSIDDFWAIYQETVDRQELSGNRRDYFNALIPYLSILKRGSVFFAVYRRIRIAAALVVFFGERATYFFGGSRAVHRNVMAPYLLHFEIMRRAKDLGHKWYDMYGIAPLTKPNDPWANFSAFKRKLGGQEFSFVRALDYVYDAAAYEDFKQYRKARNQPDREP